MKDGSYRDGQKETLLLLNPKRYRLECGRQIQTLKHGPREIESKKACAVLAVFCSFSFCLNFHVHQFPSMCKVKLLTIRLDINKNMT